MCASRRGGNGGILPWLYDHFNPPRLARGETVSGGQFDWGSPLKRTEAPERSLRMDGDYSQSVKAQGA